MSARSVTAAQAVGFGDKPSAPSRMRLISFRSFVKGSLRGFASIELANGLRINECPIFLSSGKTWAALPSKPIIDREGRHHVVNGVRQYSAILEWRDCDLSDRFSAAIVELVKVKHPDALESGEH